MSFTSQSRLFIVSYIVCSSCLWEMTQGKFCFNSKQADRYGWNGPPCLDVAQVRSLLFSDAHQVLLYLNAWWFGTGTLVKTLRSLHGLIMNFPGKKNLYKAPQATVSLANHLIAGWILWLRYLVMGQWRLWSWSPSSRRVCLWITWFCCCSE